MPRGDRSGPRGLGPMTGRKMGAQAGFPDPGFVAPGRGFGRGLGLGMGRGWRQGGFGCFWSDPYPSIMPFGYPFGMPYRCSLTQSYGYPYGEDYGSKHSAPSPGQRRQKKPKKGAK